MPSRLFSLRESYGCRRDRVRAPRGGAFGRPGEGGLAALPARGAADRAARIRGCTAGPAARHGRERDGDLHAGLALLSAHRERHFRRQFRLVVQDYGAGKDLGGAIRKAVSEASRAPKVETREVKVSGLTAFAVTDRSQGNPTTLVTVLASPSRLVLGQGANIEAAEALRLLGLVDFEKVINAK